MKNSFILIAFIICGVISGLYSFIPLEIIQSKLSEYVLYALTILVGIGLGGDRNTWRTLRKANLKILLVPLVIILGTLCGAAICSLLFDDMTVQEAMAVGSGFAYYSLSSFIITRLHGETLGATALIANMIREILTLILAPLMAKYLGKLAPIAAGGATAMDTTLPIISKSVGAHFAVISIFSGLVITILVPFMVTFFLQ